MLKKELNKLEVSLERPNAVRIYSLLKGQYVLKIIHQNDAVFYRSKSFFLAFSVGVSSPLEVKNILGLGDISAQYGAFVYAGAGKEEFGYFVKEVILNITEDIPILDIELRTFLPNHNIFIEAFQIFNVKIPLEEIYGKDPSNIFFKAPYNEPNDISFLDVTRHTFADFILNRNLDRNIIIKNLDRGKYLLKILHSNKTVFDKYNSLFIAFQVAGKSSEYVKDILGLNSISSQDGAFSYIGGGKLNTNGYEQEIILNVIEPIVELEVSLKSFLAENTSIDTLVLEKIIEENKIYTSKSVTTRAYPQYWTSHITDKDNFIFEENVSPLQNFEASPLNKEGSACTILVSDIDTLTLRVNLSAQENHHLEKQAIITINYLDANNNSIESEIDSPYSSKLKKYYHYLSVNPEYNNNLHLLLPKNVVAVELAIQLWDNKSDIMFDGKFQFAQHKQGISVIVPSYKGEETILRCLKSLSSQTLSSSAFEVIVALNGERDSTRERIEQYQKICPDFNIRILELNSAGAGYARNEALKNAKFSYATFVDDDDYIDKNYLSHLYEKASWNTITLTGVNDVLDETERLLESSILTQLKKASEKEIITYHDVTSLLTMNACKMAPIHMVKSIAYNEDLKSGEDVVYWSLILSTFIPLLELSNNFEKAVYYRVITNQSVSRQGESYEFNVQQRLDVISDLLVILNLCEKERFLKSNISFIQSKINAQALFIKRYLDKYPNDYANFQLEINDRQLSNKFISIINESFTKRLVISYCFAPYADTSAVVMSKRINKMPLPVDVISNSMSNVRTKDESLTKIAFTNIGKHIELVAPQSFANWNAIVSFSEMVVRKVGEIISTREMYQEIYSRAMWPASHFAAALIKKKFPHVKWIAEFSDPLLKNVTGENRYSQLSLEWLEKHCLIDQVDSKELMNDNIFYWCEKLVYNFADEIIYTNKNQQEYMMSYADIPFSTIQHKSKIVPQPTLDERYYSISNVHLEKEDEYIYIGYFGSFYVNRGFDSFFDAWKNLSPEVKNKIRLCVYTQQDPKLILKEAPSEIREQILIFPYVQYFDFLCLAKQFDLLLVMDAKIEGLNVKNPYLPSKISDYLGSQNNVLALIDEGSPIDNIKYKNLYKVRSNSLDTIKKFMEGYLVK